MANRLFSQNPCKIGNVQRNLKVILGASEPVRDYSNQGWRKKKNTYVEQVLFGHLDRQPPTVWPDPNLGCLGPKDTRLSLPGNVGLETVLKKEKASPEELLADKKRMEAEISFWRNLCESPTNYQKQFQALKQHEEMDRLETEEMEKVERILRGRSDPVLECKAQSCPDLLRRELAGLFVNTDINDGPLSVITFSQRTQNDMSVYSPHMEEERDKLIENFITSAKEMCNELRRNAVWADFVDPVSGRPFYSPYTNVTFFETDERYRTLGFRIQDLGCCKVISHHKWGTHVFVGSIFTTAPADCEYLQDIITKVNKQSDETTES